MPCGHLAVFVLRAAFVLRAGTAVLACNTGPGPPANRLSANRLSGETILYLRAHARNPVDWYPVTCAGRDVKAVAEYIRNGVQ